MDDNRKKALNAALSQIEKQFGKGSIMRLGESEVGHRNGLEPSPGQAGEGPVIGGERGGAIDVTRPVGGDGGLMNDDVAAFGHPSFLLIELGRVESEIESLPRLAALGHDHGVKSVGLGFDLFGQVRNSVRRRLAVRVARTDSFRLLQIGGAMRCGRFVLAAAVQPAVLNTSFPRAGSPLPATLPEPLAVVAPAFAGGRVGAAAVRAVVG